VVKSWLRHLYFVSNFNFLPDEFSLSDF